LWQTNNLHVRLNDHNSGSTISNKYGIPWILIGFINCETRSEAMILEKKIKKRGIERWLQNNQRLLISSL
jgi:putative endonuclease